MDWGRLGMAVATGGASELADAINDKATKDAQNLVKQVTQQGLDIGKQLIGAATSTSGNAGQSVNATPPAAPSIQINASPRYQFVNGFLVDTANGRLWRYDEKSNKLLIVNREVTEIENSWNAILRAKATADLVDELNTATKGASLAERLRLDKLIEPHIELIDKDVKAMAAKGGR